MENIINEPFIKNQLYNQFPNCQKLDVIRDTIKNNYFNNEQYKINIRSLRNIFNVKTDIELVGVLKNINDYSEFCYEAINKINFIMKIFNYNIV